MEHSPKPDTKIAEEILKCKDAISDAQYEIHIALNRVNYPDDPHLDYFIYQREEIIKFNKAKLILLGYKDTNLAPRSIAYQYWR